MSRASRGADFERACRAVLLEAGWYVTRAAGSHGPADLVAISPHEVGFVQCKLGGPGAFAPLEWNQLFELARSCGGVALIAHRPARGVLRFERLIGRKEGRTLRPPCELWVPEELAAGWADAPVRELLDPAPGPRNGSQEGPP